MSDVFGLLQLLLVGLVIAAVYAIAWTMYRITHPPRRTYAHAVSRGRPGDPGELPTGPSGAARTFESWTFRTRDGLMLPVWEMAGDAPDGPVLILTHGWGDSRIGALTRVQPLLPHVARAIMWDMRGSGDAPGVCSLGTREVDDLCVLIEAVADGLGESATHAASEHARGDARLFLLGWSLGGGVSIAAAARLAASDRPSARLVRCVIAEAPYRLALTPARNVMSGSGVPTTAILRVAFAALGMTFRVGPSWRGFDRADHAARLRCRLVVLHGTLDEISPVADGREIAAAAQEGTLIEIEAGGHHSLWTHPELAPRTVAAASAAITNAR